MGRSERQGRQSLSERPLYGVFCMERRARSCLTEPALRRFGRYGAPRGVRRDFRLFFSDFTFNSSKLPWIPPQALGITKYFITPHIRPKNSTETWIKTTGYELRFNQHDCTIFLQELTCSSFTNENLAEYKEFCCE